MLNLVDFHMCQLSKHQVPAHQKRAEHTRCPKHRPRRALALRRPLQLPVSAAHVLRRRERVLHQLVDVRRLYAEVVRKGGLQLRDFEEGLFGGTGRVRYGQVSVGRAGLTELCQADPRTA
jgi:hypothetical protein